MEGLTGGGLIRSAGGIEKIRELQKEGIIMKGDERILGGSDFVDAVLRQAGDDHEKKRLLMASGLTLDTLIKEVARYFHIDETFIRSPIKQRTVSRARAIITHLAEDRLRVTGVEIGKALKLTPSAVSRLAARGRIDPLSREVEGVLPIFTSGG